MIKELDNFLKKGQREGFSFEIAKTPFDTFIKVSFCDGSKMIFSPNSIAGKEYCEYNHFMAGDSEPAYFAGTKIEFFDSLYKAIKKLQQQQQHKGQ